MSYYTETELRAYAPGVTANAARESLRIESKSALGRFDIFLSHSVRDAAVIMGLRNLLTRQGLTVYVDWIDDAQLDRSRVSPATAAHLRERMSQSRSLVYATSKAAATSRWMPWELGYFDGLRGSEQISICPIDDLSGSSYAGQEYLGLYKVIEKVRTPRGTEPRAVRQSRTSAESLGSFARGQRQYVNL